MPREAISSERPQEEISPLPLEEEPKALAHLKEEFGKYFTSEQLARISKEPDRLYFYLPPIFNRLDPEKWPRLQNLALEILVREKPSEKVIKFPAEKPTFLERIRKLPAIRALGLGLFLATLAVGYEASYLLGKEPEKPKIEEIAKPEKPPGAICTPTMCETMPEKGGKDIQKDLTRFLNESVRGFPKLSPENQDVMRPFYIQTYYHIVNRNPETKNDPAVNQLISEIKVSLGI